MEILDPDLWNDDGTPKRPSQQYMRRLEEMQDLEALDPETPKKRSEELREAYINYARVKREAREARPPEVGDIVHFWDAESTGGAVCRAAIVMETESFGHGAMLRVHIPHQAFQDWQCDHDERKVLTDTEGEPLTWHWPCGEGQ